MLEYPQKTIGSQLEIEFCQALFEKNPDKLIELLSEWLEVNQLKTSDQFNIPDYLRELLFPRDRSAVN
ncbi:MAG: hypothetical protein ABJP14_01765 [Roseibium sp.]